jgi:hypothetical protein
LVCGLALLLSAGAAEVELLNGQTPWRAFLVTGPRLNVDGDGLRIADRRDRKGSAAFDPASADVVRFQELFSRLPAADWASADFDDSCWARYLPSDLDDYLGDYGLPAYWGGQRWPWPALLCLRTRFGIADPARVKDLEVTVVGLGGMVVYVNGREVGRGFLPRERLNLLTPAEKYPIEAYTAADGVTALPEVGWQAKSKDAVEEALRPRYEKRIRRLTLKVPPETLVKGANVLGIGIHQSPIAGPLQRGGWVHLGVRSVTLTSASGTGVIPYAEAVGGTRVWSAIPEEQVFDTPSDKPLARRIEGRMTAWMRGKLYRGIQCGNPFDRLAPLRMAVPRNGVGSGQVVLTDMAGLRDISATMGALKGAAGEIPASAVEVRYAAQQGGLHFCDALMPTATQGARTVPVWVIVQAPRNQPPGWYAGTLTLAANEKSFAAPVQVLVRGLTLADARDFAPNSGIASSADTLALHYKVEPWSDEHYRLLEPSFRMLGQLGNDVLQVPVILGGMYGAAARDWATRGSAGVRCRPLVRWVRDGERVRPEFSLLERYLDAYLKHCAPPKALSLYVWDSGCSREVADAYEGRRVPTREFAPKSPLLVQRWDPASGATSDLPAPNFAAEGAEAFWKPLFEGVRRIVTKRGWSERVIMAGIGGDLRPSQREGDLLRQWAPYVRWQILSHFSGDPGPKDGKQMATGGLEVGVKEYPWRSFVHVFTAAELERDLTVAQPSRLPTGRQDACGTNGFEYLDLPTARWHWKDDSPPFLFRTLPMIWGSLGHLGLDFWSGVQGAPRNTSFFTESSSMTVPGPHGALPTVRFQMLREGVQDMEIRLMMIRAARTLPADRRQAVYELLDEFPRRAYWGTPYLSQCELSYDWRSYAARVQEAAAELVGVKTEAKWEAPPK